MSDVVPGADVDDVLRASWDGQVTSQAMFEALSKATLLLAVRSADADPPDPYVFEFSGPSAAVFTSSETTAMLPDAPAFIPILGSELGRRWPAGLTALLNPGSGPLTRLFAGEEMRFLADPQDVPAHQPHGTALAPFRRFAEPAKRSGARAHTPNADPGPTPGDGGRP